MVVSMYRFLCFVGVSPSSLTPLKSTWEGQSSIANMESFTSDGQVWIAMYESFVLLMTDVGDFCSFVPLFVTCLSLTSSFFGLKLNKSFNTILLLESRSTCSSPSVKLNFFTHVVPSWSSLLPCCCSDENSITTGSLLLLPVGDALDLFVNDDDAGLLLLLLLSAPASVFPVSSTRRFDKEKRSLFFSAELSTDVASSIL
mmetsp:Transcript_59507/g.70914  ORF Transcript_59507/g.70914 Transcript_59507/m.70914 type:complete len:200 (-) Transcript_59507:589-1188(-)